MESMSQDKTNDIQNITEYVYELVNKYKKENSKKEKLIYGQFFTPLEIVRYILRNIDTKKKYTSFLDPAAGFGNLVISVVEYLIDTEPDIYKNSQLKIVVFEIDTNLIKGLTEGLFRLNQKARNKINTEIEYEIHNTDFLNHYEDYIRNSNKMISLVDFFEEGISANKPEVLAFDLIILNPPYRKLKAVDPRNIFLKQYTGGHTNLYTSFLGICKLLLNKENGLLIGIIPRSFCNGLYFKDFRKKFLHNNNFELIATIEDRDRIFAEDKILQENIIIFTKASFNPNNDILVKIDLLYYNAEENKNGYNYSLSTKYTKFINSNKIIKGENLVILIPSTEVQFNLLENPIDGVSLNELGLKVSTGQLVQHRSREYIINPSDDLHYTLLKEYNNNKSIEYYPLLQSLNIYPNNIIFPRNDITKPQFVHASCLKYSVDKSNFIIMRRMSSKDEDSRIITAKILKSDFSQVKRLVFDNKTNFIHLPNVQNIEIISQGLVNYLSSSYLDELFRIISGNTQVNSSDFDLIPIPNFYQLYELGLLSFEDKLSINNYINKIRFNDMSIETNDFQELINQAIEILNDLEISHKITREKAGIILIILCDIKKPNDWKNITNLRHTINNDRSIDPETNENFHAIMKEAKEKYNFEFKDREEIRRKALHWFFNDGLVHYNDDNPKRPTNSSRNNYRLKEEVKIGIQKFGTPDWKNYVSEFLKNEKKEYKKERRKRLEKITFKNSLGEEVTAELSQKRHGYVEKTIIQEFTKTNFIKEPVVLYLGNTQGGKYVDKSLWEKLGIELDLRGKLPDLLLYDIKRDWIYIFEVVTNHGSIDNKRVNELNKIFKKQKEKLIFITAFESLEDFAGWKKEIAFETEVWIANMPLHMIHYNGDRFLGPRE